MSFMQEGFMLIFFIILQINAHIKNQLGWTTTLLCLNTDPLKFQVIFVLELSDTMKLHETTVPLKKKKKEKAIFLLQ